MQFRISEIFLSVQGESSSVGFPTAFIRLTGCPLRCNYCDTTYAFKGGEKLDLETILTRIREYSVQYVCVTGGEPLAQANCVKLLSKLCDEGYNVSLETSGALNISEVDPRVRVVMDIKTPSSGESDKNMYSNIEYLKADDEIKFVVANRDDFEWAEMMCRELGLCHKYRILFSPSYGVLANRDLADWVIASGLNVRFQLQLHKYIWGEEPGR